MLFKAWRIRRLEIKLAGLYASRKGIEYVCSNANEVLCYYVDMAVKLDKEIAECETKMKQIRSE